MAKYFIIGIGGVTNGGKTSLCKYLMEKFHMAATINMDDYFWPDEDPHHIWLEQFKYADWDVISSVDFDRMVGDVKHWVSKATTNQSEATTHPPLLFVEGIMNFNNKALMSYFHKKYFFTLTKSQCWERRKCRVYEPPEPEGYFDEVCWPWYLKYKDDLKDQTDIVYLDGSKHQETISSNVYENICRLIESR